MATLDQRLYIWYNQHRRDLPWRGTDDPYKVWVSEIILHQTRIDQGLGYYHRFIETFPDPLTLARSTTDQVLHAWQGLGYYRRAINMHRAAKHIAQESGGMMPVEYHALIALPGIGDYTASLISSVCNHEPRPAIDGNVTRFISRFFDLSADPLTSAGRKEIATHASQFMRGHPPGLVNNALMEFGALHCTPANPKCETCPFGECLALERGRVSKVPMKKKPVRQLQRLLHYMVMHWVNDSGHFVLIRKRGDDDIWAHMYDFPEMMSVKETPDEKELVSALSGQGADTGNLIRVVSYGPYQHLLTHQKITAWFHHIHLTEAPGQLHQDQQIIPVEKLSDFAKPKLIAKHLMKPGFSL